jgi:uncharacterized membrane protein
VRIDLLLGTIALRPYVFLFLAAYLLLALAAWGWRRALLYALLGYVMAWAAEYSSIHTGVPFGPYAYISGPTIDRELWVAGVPFMDSLSCVFAGLQTARLVREALTLGGLGAWDIRWVDPTPLVRWPTWLLAGLLTTGLDVVIDPLALRGDRWFLGRIYVYPDGGPYWGVPIANFVGWAVVSWAVIGAFLLLERFALQRWLGPWRSCPADALRGAGLFAGVLAFNLAATFAIGEPGLGLLGCLWAALLLGPAVAKVRRLASRQGQLIDRDEASSVSAAGG